MADAITPAHRTPWHLWVIGVVSLLWNCVGALDFTMTQTRNAAYLHGLTQVQREYFFSIPPWVMAAWGIATWGGVIGSILLLLRRREAYAVFLLSLFGIILTNIYTFLFSAGLKIMGGTESIVLSAVIFAVALPLLLYAKTMRRRGVLR